MFTKPLIRSILATYKRSRAAGSLAPVGTIKKLAQPCEGIAGATFSSLLKVQEWTIRNSSSTRKSELLLSVSAWSTPSAFHPNALLFLKDSKYLFRIAVMSPDSFVFIWSLPRPSIISKNTYEAAHKRLQALYPGKQLESEITLRLPRAA